MAQVEAARVIQSQHPDRSAPNRCGSFNPRFVQAKVAGPPVQARMEQSRDLVGEGVDTGKVGPLLQIAAMAGQCQVSRFIRATMLFGDDVFDVVRKVAVLLSQQAVLATILSPHPDQISRLEIGHWFAFAVSLRCALSLRMAIKSAALIRAS